MAKPMEDRTVSIGPIYTRILGKFPVLKKGLFNPDLTPLCAKYDKGIKDYGLLAQRKKNITVFLDQFSLTINAYIKDVDANNDQRVKVRDANLVLINKVTERIRGFITEGEKADNAKVLVALKDYAAANQTLNVQNSAHRDKTVKLEDQLGVNLKKVCDNYEKESNAIKAAVGKLEAEADAHEAQIRQVVLTYKKKAVQSDNEELETALQEVIAGFS